MYYIPTYKKTYITFKMKMKLLFIALCACCLLSCGDDELDNGQSNGLVSIEFDATQDMHPQVSKAENTVEIKFKSAMAWTASFDDKVSAWCLLSDDDKAGAAGDAIVISVTVVANTEENSRSGILTLGSGDLMKTIIITQATGEIFASIEFPEDQDLTIDVSNAANEVPITFLSTKAWTASVDADALSWCVLSDEHKAGEAGENLEINASVSANPDSSPRVATITFVSDDVEQSVTITQPAATVYPVNKLTILRGESSSFHDGPIGSEGPIENAFDGVLTGDAIYHSHWNGGVSESTPVVNEFFITEEGVTAGLDVNRLVITQRNGGNGLLKTFKVYVKTAETPSDSYGVEVGSATDLPANSDTFNLNFDTKSNVTSVVLVHTGGHGIGNTYVAYQEVELFCRIFN